MLYVIFATAVLAWAFGRRLMDRDNLRLTLPIWLVLVGLLVLFMVTALLGFEEIVHCAIMHQLTAIVLWAAGFLCLLVSLFAGTAPLSNTRRVYQAFWLLLGLAFLFAGVDKFWGLHRGWQDGIGALVGMGGKDVTLVTYGTLAIVFLVLFHTAVVSQGLAGGRMAGAWLLAGLVMFFAAAGLDMMLRYPDRWSGAHWWFQRILELEEFSEYCAALLWLSSAVVALVESDRTIQLRSAPALPRRWKQDIEDDESGSSRPKYA